MAVKKRHGNVPVKTTTEEHWTVILETVGERLVALSEG